MKTKLATKPKRLMMALLAGWLFLLAGHQAMAVYNSTTGRWLSRDPMEERGGENLYCMVWNDAINLWDYLGLGCSVHFKCTLNSTLPSKPGWGGITRNCPYSCTEKPNSREDTKGATPVTCADLPKGPLTISYDTSVVCKSCPKAINDLVQWFESDDLKLDCSRSDCRSGCDFAFAAAMKSKNPVIRAGAIAAKQLCYDSCSSVCRNP